MTVPRGLRRGCEAARLLGLRLRIQHGGIGVYLLQVLCVVRYRSLLIHRSPTECASDSDHEAYIMGRPCTTRGCCTVCWVHGAIDVLDMISVWGCILRFVGLMCKFRPSEVTRRRRAMYYNTKIRRVGATTVTVENNAYSECVFVA